MVLYRQKLKKKSNYPFPSVEKKKSEFSLFILYPLLLICHVFFKIGSEIIFFLLSVLNAHVHLSRIKTFSNQGGGIINPLPSRFAIKVNTY